jgi:F-type H+-transporting ATPase subunit epsilon
MMHLKIITHEKVVFDEDIDAVTVKGVDGEFGVLSGHIPVMAALDIGVTTVAQGHHKKFFTTMGGVFQFKDEQALILTNTAEHGDEIDSARAKEAMTRAQSRLAEQAAELDAQRAQASLARAMARLKATTK